MASVGAGEGGVWLVVDGPSCATSLVARVDPRSLRVFARIVVHEGAAAVRVGHEAVWVTNPSRSVVQKIDARRNRVVATTRVGPQPRFLAAWEDGVWTLNQKDGSVMRLNPASGEVAATIPAEVIGEGGGFGAVWLSAHDVETVWRLPVESP
jgi:DNA-binding beta-propeller fold protein YncE